MDPRTPVLVGVGAEVRRDDDPTGLDHVGLMLTAAEQAFADADADGLAKRTDAVLVPRGAWANRDPGRVVAERLGAPAARTTMAELGVPQLSIIRRACELVVDGSADVVLVAGGEARYRAGVARRADVQPPVSPDVEASPDETLRPDADLMARAEATRHLNVAAHQYAVIESTLRAQAGRTPAEHSAHLGRLWAAFAAVAATNPDAWDRSAPSAEVIATPGPANRMLATPYTKLLCSQWNVDQSAALVLTSARTAEAAGVPREKWVHPLAMAESNFILSLSLRRDINRWPSFAVAAERLFSMAGLSVTDVGPVDLYSCFPSAVQMAALELGLPLDPAPTVTGGMTFAGGPLNNYVFQAVVTMARRLRSQAGAVGLTTAVSGLLTKPAMALWSTEPGDRPFSWADVSAEAEAATAQVPLEPDATGPGTIAGCTVVYADGEPALGVAVVDTAGVRTVATCDDRAVARAMTDTEWVGAPVQLTAPGVFHAPT